jgi:hypothetical protein
VATGARATGAGGDTSARDGERTPAQWYCLIFGATLLLVGIVGFFVDAGFDTGSSIDGDKLLGIFEVSGIHNLIHIASGAVLLAASPKRASARLVAIAFGVVYLLVTIIGFIQGDNVLGIIPVNTADNFLHVAISLLGIGAGLASSADDTARSPVAGRDSGATARA